jgi:deazaflavin-dependent oxidoreductase (nitroreductase family)
MSDHYKAPGLSTRLFNKMVAGLTRLGVSVWGSRILEVRGRKSGLPRRTPVNLLVYEGNEYLVAARGQTEWVRNVRADGGRLVLLLGRRRHPVQAEELEDGDKVDVLRAYLRRWKAEVGVFFDGVGPNASNDELAAIADRHPVFRLSPA